jgi:hypothetical protein
MEWIRTRRRQWEERFDKLDALLREIQPGQGEPDE